METFVGVDWASNGWICAVAGDDGAEVERHPSLLSVWHNHRDAARILIDIPIGLPSAGRRTCDELARERLGSARSSVFHVPCRAAVYAETYDEAKEINERATGHSVTSQAWGIIPRIREADEFLAEHPAVVGTVRESHPELCFTALNGWEPLETKHERDGIDRRTAILATLGDDLPAAYERVVRERIEDVPPFARRISSGSKADVLDALVLAGVARTDDLDTLPDRPELVSGRGSDGPELPMEIVYHEP